MCVCLCVVPDVVLIGEHNDSAGVRGLQQAEDGLIKLSWSRLSRDLHGLGYNTPHLGRET